MDGNNLATCFGLHHRAYAVHSTLNLCWSCEDDGMTLAQAPPVASVFVSLLQDTTSTGDVMDEQNPLGLGRDTIGGTETTYERRGTCHSLRAWSSTTRTTIETLAVMGVHTVYGY